MRTNKRCVQLLQEAKRESRCAIPATQADGKALRKRVEHGELCSPHRGLFMENEYWNTLDPAQRTIHQVRPCNSKIHESSLPVRAQWPYMDMNIHGTYMQAEYTARTARAAIKNLRIMLLGASTCQGFPNESSTEYASPHRNGRFLTAR